MLKSLLILFQNTTHVVQNNPIKTEFLCVLFKII